MKYPRTFHLPHSLGISDDDKVAKDLKDFIGQQVIITEKLDGENTSLHTTHVHARSQDSAHHDSRNWVKALHAEIKHLIPESYQIIGENMFAKHSIFYDRLSTYFYVFAVIDKAADRFLSVEETMEWCELLGLEFVPVIYQGMFQEDFEVPGCSAFGSEIEGFVVRTLSSFPVSEFEQHVVKWVRKDHVQTDVHWKKFWEKNVLR